MDIEITIKLEQGDRLSLLTDVIELVEYLVYQPGEVEVEAGMDYITFAIDFNNLKPLGELKKGR